MFNLYELLCDKTYKMACVDWTITLSDKDIHSLQELNLGS